VTSTSSNQAEARRELRKQLRAERRKLSAKMREQAARRIALTLQRRFYLHPGMRVSVYSPLFGELDIAPFVVIARRHGCEIFLPVLTDRRRKRMRFYAATGRMRRNWMGILEPEMGRSVPARMLNLVITPLVGFDATGMRLGMGAGYFDRGFAYRRLRQFWRGPRMVGVGFAMQRLPKITAAPHDVRLDAIVTEEGVIECRSTGS